MTGDWQRVKALLRNQRLAVLDYKSKAEMYRKRGVDKSFQRIISDLENASRDSYDDDTLRRAELVYDLPAGAIARVRDGGDPDMDDDTKVTSDLPPRRETVAEKRRRLRSMVDALPERQLDRVLRDVAKVLAEEQ